MRIRRLSAVFWSTCIIVFIFILYVVTDLSFKLPSIKPAVVDLDESKWSSFESKLRHIENELNQHNAIVGEIKSAVDEIVEKQSQEYHPPQNRPKDYLKEPKYREFKVVGDEPPRMHVKFNESTCPIQKKSVPKTDVQMLSMYERIMFDDKDGGVWKQGWNIEYSEDQWSQKNKLKVFIVPHSHNDPGWLKTFENYYKSQTKAIFTNMVEKLKENVGRKFIWAEISYLSLWWASDATEKEKAAFQNLLNSGNIEIVTGGWVMNDEANSHWLSVAQQLTTGHQWLLDNLGYMPKNAWSIDPFGHSSSQPYLLKLAGLENSIVQRVHYRVKKELASNRQLEFKWRQLWDGVGKTDLFTHMFPFYSYDVPHSCGPDPKICCQFDFKRLPGNENEGNGVTCPWGIAPRKITEKNVEERALMILDQWRKKAQLYRSNVVLFPLGDDFRYDRANEWDNQYSNYETLIDHINGNDELNAEVSFGTLQDYFKAVHEEVKMSDFPVLSGDFFTYADRNQHYWSGYYTSRPFYKNMDRVLLGYVRAAESITAQATASRSVTKIMSLQLRDRVELARRSLALFQHHDGVTGTSRDEVREDYAKKMHTAIKYCQSAIQQAAYYLLKEPPIVDQTQDDIYFDVDDIWRRHDEIPSRITIALDVVSSSRRIVLYNALSFKRHETLTVRVSSPHVEVFDPEGNPIMAQLSPVVSGEKRLGFAANKYELSFPVAVPPLGLAVYTVALRDSMTINKFTSYSRVRIYNADYWSVELPKMFQVEQPTARLMEDVTLQAGNSSRAVTNLNGLLKALVSTDGVTTPLHMDFVQYDTQKGKDNNSGAYLFIPKGQAQEFKPDAFPEIVVIEGIYRATLYTALNGPKTADIVLALSVYNNPSLPQTELEISNTFMIDPQIDDLELAIRFSTGVKNGDVFYTDLNGMQMIRRRYFDKIPLQANFYPLPAAAYIEDGNTRVTVLTSTALGVAALQPGQIEIMQDRRLSRDDNRGMNQGVLDNVRTRHVFKVIVEGANKPCALQPAAEHPSGQLSLGAHVSQQLQLQPLVAMHYAARGDAARAHHARDVTPAADVVLASFRSHVHAKSKDGSSEGIGMTFQRVYLDTCYGKRDVANWYPVGDGRIQLSDYLDVPPNKIYDSSLTFVSIKNTVPDGVLTLCPMEIRSVFINHTLKHG